MWSWPFVCAYVKGSPPQPSDLNLPPPCSSLPPLPVFFISLVFPLLRIVFSLFFFPLYSDLSFLFLFLILSLSFSCLAHLILFLSLFSYSHSSFYFCITMALSFSITFVYFALTFLLFTLSFLLLFLLPPLLPRPLLSTAPVSHQG